MIFCAVGPFRPVVATNIAVKYEIKRDVARKPRVHYLQASGDWAQRF